MATSTAYQGSTINHGLAFLGLLAFIVSFSGARIFTTLHPHTWVIIDGVHVHHFWCGLAILAVAGSVILVIGVTIAVIGVRELPATEDSTRHK